MRAIAALARREVLDVAARAYGGKPLSFGAEYLIPQPFDPRLLVELALSRGACGDGFPASRRVRSPTSMPIAKNSTSFVFRTGLIMKPCPIARKADPKRVVYAEGEEETVLRAVQVIVDEELRAADPDRASRPSSRSASNASACACKPGVDFDLCDINDDPRFNDYWQHYHRIMERRGVSPALAKAVVRSRLHRDRRTDGRARRSRRDDLRRGRPLRQEAQLHP